MNNRFTKYFCLLVCLVCLIPSVKAAPPVVKAQLDSTTLLMGKMTTLRVSVEKDKSTPGAFPLLTKVREDGIIPLCGDSVELRASIKSDTVEVSPTRQKITLEIPVQSFDSGQYKLPAFVYICGADSAKSGQITLNVVPVKVTVDTPIDGYPPVEEPENKSIFDAVPDWVINYWWILLIVLAVAAAFWWAVRRYKKEGSILPKKPEPTPYEAAVSALQRLKVRKLWEKGMEKEYFTELTDILRIYLEGRFGINAMEMTTRQIMQTLAENPEVKDKREYFRQILGMADFVKFAKVRPLPADNIAAFDNAVKFVEETKPVEKPEETSADNKKPEETEKKGGKKK